MLDDSYGAETKHVPVPLLAQSLKIRASHKGNSLELYDDKHAYLLHPNSPSPSLNLKTNSELWYFVV